MKDMESARKEIDSLDKELVNIFEKRMKLCAEIAEYKSKNEIPVYDASREAAVIEKSSVIGNESIRRYCAEFLKNNMELSKRYQCELLDFPIPPVMIKSGGINELGSFFDLERKTLVVTDSGVPQKYLDNVVSQCENAFTLVLPQGEKSKSLESFELICKELLENKFGRDDCVIALGGGMVGDLSGFAAASYMRGIDFYNIPTTVLAQTDASIGGKTAIDFCGIKNSVGAFYPAKAVLIDTKLLETLPRRHFVNGLAEAVKVAALLDTKLFEIFENGNVHENIDEIITRSVIAKQKVVSADEHENGIRRVLNFGHTIGHAVESASGLLHGESVAIGMLPMCEKEAARRIEYVLKKLGLPTEWNGNPNELLPIIEHDKKSAGDKINTVICDGIGKYHFELLSPEEIIGRMKKGDTKNE